MGIAPKIWTNTVICFLFQERLTLIYRQNNVPTRKLISHVNFILSPRTKKKGPVAKYKVQHKTVKKITTTENQKILTKNYLEQIESKISFVSFFDIQTG